MLCCRSCSSPFLDGLQECVPLHVIGKPEQPSVPPSVCISRSRLDGDESLIKRDATMPPIKHQRSMSQPWNGLMIDRAIYEQSRCKSEEDVGVEVGSLPEQHTAIRGAASSWSDSVREAYERQSSRAGSHSRSTSRAVSQESLLDDNSTETAHQPTSSRDEANMAASTHQTRNKSTASSEPSWLGRDPDNCTTVHHQLRLYYDLQLFTEDDEQFDSHFKVFPSAVTVISSSNCCGCVDCSVMW